MTDLSDEHGCVASQIIAQVGHLALILPHFATGLLVRAERRRLLSNLGEDRWETLPVQSLRAQHFLTPLKPIAKYCQSPRSWSDGGARIFL